MHIAALWLSKPAFCMSLPAQMLAGLHSLPPAPEPAHDTNRRACARREQSSVTVAQQPSPADKCFSLSGAIEVEVRHTSELDRQ